MLHIDSAHFGHFDPFAFLDTARLISILINCVKCSDLSSTRHLKLDTIGRKKNSEKKQIIAATYEKNIINIRLFTFNEIVSFPWISTLVAAWLVFMPGHRFDEFINEFHASKRRTLKPPNYACESVRDLVAVRSSAHGNAYCFSNNINISALNSGHLIETN